jgi:hypothetical protein
MTRFRFSIASLLGLVVFIAIAVAALRAAAGGWDSALFSTVVAMLLISVLLAVHRRDQRRAFWVGFALFGWVYLAASMVTQIEARLVTTKALSYLDSTRLMTRPAGAAYFDYDGDGWLDLRVANTNALYLNAGNGTFQDVTLNSGVIANSGQPSGNGKPWSSPFMTWKFLTGPTGTSENFIRIGHSLTALVLAFLGGHLSRYLYVRNGHVRPQEED